jgi:FtsH-binding integral membrane protein
MKVEFDLNFMGVVYLLLAVGLVYFAVMAFIGAPTASHSLNSPLNIFLFVLQITVGIVAVGLLVPVIRRLFKAFMPSA